MRVCCRVGFEVLQVTIGLRQWLAVAGGGRFESNNLTQDDTSVAGMGSVLQYGLGCKRCKATRSWDLM